jgi:hypothetical protein
LIFKQHLLPANAGANLRFVRVPFLPVSDSTTSRGVSGFLQCCATLGSEYMIIALPQNGEQLSPAPRLIYEGQDRRRGTAVARILGTDGPPEQAQGYPGSISQSQEGCLANYVTAANFLQLIRC